MPDDTVLSAPTSPPARTVPNKTITSTNSDSTNMKTTDNGKSLGDSPLKDAQSPLADPKVSAKNATQPDIDRVSECERSDNENDDYPEVVQDNDKDDDEYDKPLRSKQKRQKGIAAKSSKKRKANASGGKQAAESGLAQPAKKKQKVNKPTTKRQRKTGNLKPKTVKERFLAASAEDTRPLPWGQPEVWADVCSFRR